SDTAEDVVQDCLFKLWSMRGTLDEYNSPEALALTITHRLSLNAVRGRHSTVELLDEVIAGTEDSPEQHVIRSEKENEISRVMSMLPDAQQALITMRHVEGLSNAEIAQIIGSNEGAVRTALSRARNRVAEIFMKYQLSNK
ncbi:MAG: RNA polymerase sigma factor, partial [Muribaculaceae bacterium]|nr:RNA polymerase sigma factor [Muribaculaceae bacterium]